MNTEEYKVMITSCKAGQAQYVEDHCMYINMCYAPFVDLNTFAYRSPHLPMECTCKQGVTCVIYKLHQYDA